jgi:hypothetical protein
VLENKPNGMFFICSFHPFSPSTFGWQFTGYLRILEAVYHLMSFLLILTKEEENSLSSFWSVEIIISLLMFL